VNEREGSSSKSNSSFLQRFDIFGTRPIYRFIPHQILPTMSAKRSSTINKAPSRSSTAPTAAIAPAITLPIRANTSVEPSEPSGSSVRSTSRRRRASSIVDRFRKPKEDKGEPSKQAQKEAQGAYEDLKTEARKKVKNAKAEREYDSDDAEWWLTPEYVGKDPVEPVQPTTTEHRCKKPLGGRSSEELRALY
jgi:hypothetical protein